MKRPRGAVLTQYSVRLGQKVGRCSLVTLVDFESVPVALVAARRRVSWGHTPASHLRHTSRRAGGSLGAVCLSTFNSLTSQKLRVSFLGVCRFCFYFFFLDSSLHLGM